MARPSSRHPTELELEILKILWQTGPMSVRQVRDALDPVRKLAHTSVITIMNIMVDKGYLARRKKGARYVFRPRVTRRATTGRMLRDLVNRVFDGSASAVMVHLLESGELDEAEIERLRKLLNHKSMESER